MRGGRIKKRTGRARERRDLLKTKRNREKERELEKGERAKKN